MSDNPKVKDQRKNKIWKRAKLERRIMYVSSALIGVAIGRLTVKYTEPIFADIESLGEYFLCWLGFIGVMYIAMYIQVILHESGHLIFGLLTGYHFESFRVGSFLLKWESGRLRLCRFSLFRTLGQCLMAPPEMIDGKIPYVLYHMGGVIVNIVTAVVFGVCYLFCSGKAVPSLAFLLLTAFSAMMALANGIPLYLGNDGYNVISIGESSEALRSNWLRLKVNELISKGERLKEMPEEWFVMPSEEAMENRMVAAVGVLCYNRILDKMDLEKAASTATELLEMETGMSELHRRLLIVDRVYFELIDQNRRGLVDSWLDKDQKSFMKSMKNYPSVLRTEYAYALLAEHDRGKFEKIREKFEKMAKTYPDPAELEGERELMDYAVQVAEARMSAIN